MTTFDNLPTDVLIYIASYFSSRKRRTTILRHLSKSFQVFPIPPIHLEVSHNNTNGIHLLNDALKIVATHPNVEIWVDAGKYHEMLYLDKRMWFGSKQTQPRDVLSGTKFQIFGAGKQSTIISGSLFPDLTPTQSCTLHLEDLTFDGVQQTVQAPEWEQDYAAAYLGSSSSKQLHSCGLNADVSKIQGNRPGLILNVTNAIFSNYTKFGLHIGEGVVATFKQCEICHNKEDGIKVCNGKVILWKTNAHSNASSFYTTVAKYAGIRTKMKGGIDYPIDFKKMADYNTGLVVFMDEESVLNTLNRNVGCDIFGRVRGGTDGVNELLFKLSQVKPVDRYKRLRLDVTLVTEEMELEEEKKKMVEYEEREKKRLELIKKASEEVQGETKTTEVIEELVETT